MRPQHRNSFTENIGVLFEELKLAMQWNRPSILLAICNSRSGKIKAENDLKNKLTETGFDVVRIEVNSHSSLVSHQIVKSSNSEQVVFFVTNLSWGSGPDGKDAYRDLNMTREALVENHIKAVFWLTRKEASDLPASAPDFWAFRHRVVEFAVPRVGKKIKLPASILIWHGQNFEGASEEAISKIEMYEKLLTELPAKAESLSSRIELLYTIGYLYWILGNTAKASETLQSGIELINEPELSTLKMWLSNALAIIDYEKGEHKKAAETYNDLVVGNQSNSALRINLGIALCELGKYSNAITEGKRAIKLSMSDAKVWNRLGYIYMSAGKLDEAVQTFEKAIALLPTASAFYKSLAISYYLFGLTDESINQIRSAYRYAEDQTFPVEIYEQAIRGKSEKSLELLKTALTSGKISKADIRRNANIQILLDAPLLKSLPD